jgi:hypothetical protein
VNERKRNKRQRVKRVKKEEAKLIEERKGKQDAGRKEKRKISYCLGFIRVLRVVCLMQLSIQALQRLLWLIGEFFKRNYSLGICLGVGGR